MGRAFEAAAFFCVESSEGPGLNTLRIRSGWASNSGSHTRATLESRHVWRWLLLATATYAAEQPRIRTFPTLHPVDAYPQATLQLPAQVESAASAAAAAVATVQDMAPRPPVPPVHLEDTRILAQDFALLWSPTPTSCPMLQQLRQCRSFCIPQAASSVPSNLSKYCFDVYLPSTDVLQLPLRGGSTL